jgi:hypothetical protein
MRNLLVRGLVVLGCVTGGRGNTNVVHGRQRRAQDMITIVRICVYGQPDGTGRLPMTAGHPTGRGPAYRLSPIALDPVG